jgi:hypothetical protein
MDILYTTNEGRHINTIKNISTKTKQNKTKNGTQINDKK